MNSFFSEQDLISLYQICTGIPESFLRSWSKGNNKKYHCTKCSTHYTDTILLRSAPQGSNECPTCHSIGSIVPCITAYCEFGDEIWT